MKKVYVKVKTGKKEENIEVVSENSLKVEIKELPKEGKANLALIKVLSDYYGVPKINVELVKGFRSRNKVFIIKT